MSSLVQLTEGMVFAGDFRVVRPLSAGGMGAVYVVEQVSTGMQRALKLMHPQLVTDPALRRRFEQEARVGSQIDSEHVVQVLAAGVDAPTGMPWLVMELLKGEDLAGYVARSGPIAPSMVRQIFDQLCHALGAAHASGIVHRDLKPENIYLLQAKRAGVQFMVKVLDFGIAKIVADAKKTETAALGSPMWMSPEQTARGHQISPASDVWALGLIGFHLLTGRYYWRSAEDHQATLTNLLREIVLDTMAPPSQRAAELGCGEKLPRGFDSWFERCCARDPRGRFQTASEANSEFQRILAGAPDVSNPAQTPYNAALAPTGYAAPATGAFGPPAGTPPYGPPPGQAQRAPTPAYGPPPVHALGPTQTPPFGPGGTPAYGPPPAAINPPTAYAPPPPPQAFLHGGTPPPPQQGSDAMYGPGTPIAGSYTNPRPDYGPPMGPPAQPMPAAAPQGKSSMGLVLGLLAGVVVIGGGIGAFVVFGGKKDSGKTGTTGSAASSGSAVPSSAAAAPAAHPSDDISGKMTPLPSGTFQMGSKDEDDEKPIHEVKVAAFEMDTTEVTVSAWKACEKAGVCRVAPSTIEIDEITEAYKKAATKYCNGGRTDHLDHPINCVDWSDAAGFCTWAGKRLPTEAEWEYAARVTKAGTAEPRLYPWGKAPPDPMLVNGCGTECVAMLKREDLLVKGQTTDPMYKGDDQFSTTSPVSSFPRGATDLGIQDMSGNVSEWTADWYTDKYPVSGFAAANGTKRVNRGGSWDEQDARWVRSTARAKDPPGARDVILGFRCARDAKQP